MAQGRADSIRKPVSAAVETLSSLVPEDKSLRGAQDAAGLLDLDHPRITAVLTRITDEDYRCVWRPCHAFEEDEEGGGDEQSAKGEGRREGIESRECSENAAAPGERPPGG